VTHVRPKLLIIDDDPAICQLIADIARSFDYVTDIASTPPQMSALVGGGHDLVMLDLSLGETDGMKVMRDLAERQPGANLVLLTGADLSVLQGARRVAELSGFNVVGTCSKPARIDQIEAVLKPQQIDLGDADPTDDDTTRLAMRALDTGAFYLVYQPIVDLQHGRVVGAEALVRIDDIGGEKLSPEVFVPLIERAGRTYDLLNIVFTRAAQDRRYVPGVAALDTVAINMSVLDLGNLDLPEVAESILGAAAASDRWTLEITETAEVGKLADALDVLIRLRLKGFHLAMDDFGSGTSTLNRLRELPFTDLKADRRFVRASNPGIEHASNMLKAAVDLGAALNLRVVAEGIETREEFDLARTVGCDMAQGYYIGRPVRAEALGILAASWNQNAAKHLQSGV
jgi:hypothetical protein